MITRQSLLLLVTLPRGRSRSGTTHPTDFETETSMGNVFSSLWWSSYSEWSEVPDPFAMHWWHQPFRSAARKNTQNGSCTCSASLRSAGQLRLKSWLKSNRRNRQALNRNYPLTSLEQLSWSFLLGGGKSTWSHVCFWGPGPEWKECQIFLVSYLIRAATKQFPPSFKHYSTTRHLWLVAPRHLPGLAFNGKSVDCWKGQPNNSL